METTQALRRISRCNRSTPLVVRSNRRNKAGEAEAIGLALQEQAEWFLTDDAKARQFAESLGLEVHGSIAILLWSVATGLIQEKAVAIRLLENLANSSLWISDRVIQEAQAAIDSLFE